MVHTPTVAAAATSTDTSSAPSSSRRKSRTSLPKKNSSYLVPYSSTLSPGVGSVASPSGSLDTRQPLYDQSSHKYHTFPTPPPKTPNEQPEPIFPPPSPGSRTASPASGEGDAPADGNISNDSDVSKASPLPVRQLVLLFLLSMSEQTALNSISPYIPTMIESFGIEKVGMYVGLLGSAFAVAQVATSFLWGALADAVGRKPIMLLGTALLAGCFTCFGLCANFTQVMVVHVAMGLVNGNGVVVPTILGEITDRTNQSIVFGWLPVVYTLGSITGPAVGGLLVGTFGENLPFLPPNAFSAALLGLSVVVLSFLFEETLEAGSRIEKLGELGRDCLGRSRKLWPWRVGRDSGSRRLSRMGSSEPDEETGLLNDTAVAENTDMDDDAKTVGPFSWRAFLNKTTVAIFATYLIFQVANISFNCLYPIFAEDDEPAGRNLSPGAVGVSLSVAGIATIFFQIFLFQPIKARLGNLGMYRWAILGLAVSLVLLPFIGRVDDPPALGMSGKVWLYAELGVVLVIKNVCAVSGLASAMLLITNSAPSNDTLGTLNGLAQTLSAAGRSFGPVLAGSLFSATEGIRPRGEIISFCIFGGISLLGWLGSLAIDGSHLESQDQAHQPEHEAS